MHFSDISLLVVVAASFGLLAKVLKQPLLIGYLFAGLVLSILGVVQDPASLESFANIGIALLLFLLGLEMNLKELPEIGKVALFTGVGQIVFTSTIGFLLASILGFDTLPSVYIAVALTFSSTIIMVKLLSEKKDLGSLYGRISVGFLLVQDFVAVIILMFLSGLGASPANITDFGIIAIKAIFLFLAVWLLSKKALPYVFDKVISNSTELLFITSIAWALGVAGLVAGPLGFSIEIGGFLAGIALSNLPEHLQIASKTRPLRDFFLVIFFLTLGTQLTLGVEAITLITPAVILSLFVLIGNPIIVLIIMGLLGYRKRTSFLAGLTVAQISEFSLILMNMGRNVGHFGDTEVSIVVMVAVITMTLSTYMIMGADKLYALISKYLSVFELRKTKEGALIKDSDKSDHVVIVGADRTGSNLVYYLKRKGTETVVIDFNPYVYKKLTADNIEVVFGDMNDPEILDAANVDKAKLLVSTSSVLSANLTLLSYLKRLSNKPNTIFTAETKIDATRLYEAGASYVIVPDVVAGDFIRHLMDTYSIGSKRIVDMGESHFRRLTS